MRRACPRWVATINAYGEIEGPEPWDGREPERAIQTPTGLAYRGVGLSPDESVSAARRRWRERLPELRCVLRALEQAVETEEDIRDAVVIAEIRDLTGADPRPSGSHLVPASSVHGWLSLFRGIIVAHTRE